MRFPLVVRVLLLAGGVGPATADAAVRPDLTPSRPGGVPAAGATMDGFTVSLLTRNVGRAQAKRVSVALFLSKDRRRSAKDLRLATTLSVGTLRSRKHARRRARVVIPADATSGRWFVLACVDPDREVREAEEGNNCASSGAVQVRGPSPLKATLTRHDASAVDQLMVNGSTVSVEGPDGTFYALSLGENDAAGFTNVKLTPLTVTVPSSGGVTPQGGVLIEPAGRLLQEGATLSIYPPRAAATQASRLLGFAAAGDGSEFHLQPATAERDGVEIPVLEFGVYGYGLAPATASASAARSGGAASGLNIPSATRHQFAQRAGEVLRRDDDVTPVACDYFTATVVPRLRLAARTGNRQQVAPVVQDARWIMRLSEVAGRTLSGGCFDEAYGLFGSILDRFFNEAYERCVATGGDPFAEAPEMIRVWREQQLLGVHDESTSEDKARKIADCVSFEYEASYQTQHQSLTTGGWSASGSASGAGLRFELGAPRTVRKDMAVPPPSAQFSGDCSGSFLDSQGSYGVRSWLVEQEQFVGRFVNGRYKPDAEVKTEFKLKVRWDSSLDANFEIDCGGGALRFDLAGSQDPREAILPVKGGTATATTGSLEPADDCTDCERATGTIEVHTVRK